MNFDYTEKTQNLINKLQAFMDENIYPNEAIYHDLVHQAENPLVTPQVMHDLKIKAKEEGLWNWMLPLE